VRAPLGGVISGTRHRAGYVLRLAPGALDRAADHLTITVFMPEDRYGQINLVTCALADAFPGKPSTP
jgi:hypothetical protein